MTKTIIVGVIATALLIGIGAGGYVLGEALAPDAGEADAARSEGYKTAYEDARHLAEEESHARGRARGVKEGRATGEDAGHRRGDADGGADAAAEFAETAAADAEAARQEALAETQERARNCNAPLFVEGYCPTDEEVARENQAESLCGSGTAEGREQAAELGIQC